MLFQAGLDIKKLPPEEFDSPLGSASGAGVIFGSTGGVMEATLRTVYGRLSGEPLPRLELEEVRSEEYKEAVIHAGEHELKVAVARGTGAARRLIDRMLEGKKEYHFVEVMACPGGCVGGGGQPIYIETNDWNEQVSHRAGRSRGLYELDQQKSFRKANENPTVLKLYREYLGEPGSPLAHKLLHSRHVSRKLYAEKPLLLQV